MWWWCWWGTRLRQQGRVGDHPITLNVDRTLDSLRSQKDLPGVSILFYQWRCSWWWVVYRHLGRVCQWVGRMTWRVTLGGVGRRYNNWEVLMLDHSRHSEIVGNDQQLRLQLMQEILARGKSSVDEQERSLSVLFFLQMRGGWTEATLKMLSLKFDGFLSRVCYLHGLSA